VSAYRDPGYAGDSHVGRVRSDNEDAFLLAPPLFAVADGLGGHQAGEVASSLAIDTLLENAPRTGDAKAHGPAERLGIAGAVSYTPPTLPKNREVHTPGVAAL